jgi:hypothetical protein
MAKSFWATHRVHQDVWEGDFYYFLRGFCGSQSLGGESPGTSAGDPMAMTAHSVSFHDKEQFLGQVSQEWGKRKEGCLVVNMAQSHTWVLVRLPHLV